MFAVKTNEEIGSHLEKLILTKYPSVRKFCIAYLDIDPHGDSEDPTQIRNISNRFSQIIHGKKSIQTYDLPIVSELLGVACEDILSCGETRVPLASRRTNYNIAFSNNEADWAEYLAREDCIAAYADEFGKTVLDYAIEFKNYKFIKYLIDKGYITLISEDPHYEYYPNFGAESTIAERHYEHPTLKTEFYENLLLRTQILSLAISNNDTDVLDRFKARILPIQLMADLHCSDLDFAKYYDEGLISAIANSKSKIFNYFLEEYKTKVYNDRYEITWIYPFLGELICECIKNKDFDKALKAIEVVIKHNKMVYEQMHKAYLKIAKVINDSSYSRSYQNALDMVKREYTIDKNKCFVSLWTYYAKDIGPLFFNIIHADYATKEVKVQSKINELNKIYADILGLPNSFIKNS